ncbi:hypothetical protein LDZ94_01885 [Bacteroides fragilis]|uniref:Uncharacterized protein n=2 Tax=Bacteroides fragilis TaxID=817 RepID=A0A9Q4IQ12_BACFG|nr:hypothetical protein [Bacteroides fragilis]MCA4536247.1 hypothetical protein [Bacteroides fragilis]MCA4545041.1 hypothetical protein [Bacteroides fragilis]MCA4558535.1 hypothetical protein [Bacteroides fragilis]MCA4589901.1 hypothetical protein [Bacteroides fragilis]MCA4603103.1 hypothetical protein [Bacteroides fragilis]
MLIEERYKEEDTGSDGVNSLPKPELSYSAGVYFFCLYFSDSLSVTDKKTR